MNYKLNKVELIVYDFDGVMTNNTVYVDQHGNESVQVSRADGLGISAIRAMGLGQVIMSTEANPVVATRAKKLGIPCLQNIECKETELKQYCESNGIDLCNVAYVGNDINDKKAMESVGWPICPKDAHQEIRDIAKIVTSVGGGEGVIREVYDLIVKYQRV